MARNSTMCHPGKLLILTELATTTKKAKKKLWKKSLSLLTYRCRERIRFQRHRAFSPLQKERIEL